MQIIRNSSHKPGTNVSDFFLNFNLLLYGIQDGFVFSFIKKRNIFLFSVGKYFEVV